MDTIAWLFIGHLVGDWLLQNDWMAKGKKKGLVTIPGFVHFLMYTLIVLGTLALSQAKITALTYFLIGIFIFCTHWLTDATNIVSYWMHHYKQTENQMVSLMVDQTVHMLVLAITAVWVSGF